MGKKKIVILGGGTGISVVVKGLKDLDVDITAIINVSDDGSSTGKLRNEFVMPAVGDIRQAIVNLSDASDSVKDLLNYRFNTYSDLNGHPIGNLLMVASYNMTGSLGGSIRLLSDLFQVRHKILPLSEDYLTLMAETVDGEIIEGESAIGNSHKKYKRIFYKEDIHISGEVINEIMSADLIIFSIGSLYTSIIPNLISSDVVSAIDKSSAKILYVCNAMTQYGETDDFKASDHLKVINSFLGDKKLDAVVVTNSLIPDAVIENYYRLERKNLVCIDFPELMDMGVYIIKDDLLNVVNGMVRHDSKKLAKVIYDYLMRWFDVFYNRS